MAIRRKTSEADGMAAVREVRAFFEEQHVAAGEPADSARPRRVPAEQPRDGAGVCRAPRSVRAAFVRFTLEELATLAPAIVWRCVCPRWV